MPNKSKKILVIIPSVNKTHNEATLEMLHPYLMPNVKLGISNVKYGGLESVPARAYYPTIPYVIQEIIRGYKAGYDAIIPSCFADPGVHESRSMVEIPVVGAGQAGLHLACLLGYRVGIIELGGTEIAAMHGKGSNWARQMVISYGLEKRVLSIRSLRLTSTELGNSDLAFKKILATAKKSLEQDGVEVLVFGCTLIMGFANQLSDALKIPVIEPLVAALNMAQTLINMNLKQSRLAYPHESEMNVKIAMKLPPTLKDYLDTYRP